MGAIQLKITLSCGAGVVAQWCNPLTLKPEQSVGVGLIPGRTLPLKRHDKGLQTQLGLLWPFKQYLLGESRKAWP